MGDLGSVQVLPLCVCVRACPSLLVSGGHRPARRAWGVGGVAVAGPGGGQARRCTHAVLSMHMPFGFCGCVLQSGTQSWQPARFGLGARLLLLLRAASCRVLCAVQPQNHRCGTRVCLCAHTHTPLQCTCRGAVQSSRCTWAVVVGDCVVCQGGQVVFFWGGVGRAGQGGLLHRMSRWFGGGTGHWLGFGRGRGAAPSRTCAGGGPRDAVRLYVCVVRAAAGWAGGVMPYSAAAVPSCVCVAAGSGTAPLPCVATRAGCLRGAKVG